MKIFWANTDSFDDADVVIVGIADESKSHALRKVTSEAPDKIREISSTTDVYSKEGKLSRGLPFGGLKKKIQALLFSNDN